MKRANKGAAANRHLAGQSSGSGNLSAIIAVNGRFRWRSLSFVVRPLRTRMKNANVFIDVDLTLVDESGPLIDGAREALQRLQTEGCHLFLWSTCGADYCRKIAALHGLTELFEGFVAKPDIVIDDMPSICITQCVYDVRQEQSWPALADRIIEKHID